MSALARAAFATVPSVLLTALSAARGPEVGTGAPRRNDSFEAPGGGSRTASALPAAPEVVSRSSLESL